MAEYKTAPHSFVKDWVYYFSRRVPNDLRHHYTSPMMSYSLRTRSVISALFLETTSRPRHMWASRHLAACWRLVKQARVELHGDDQRQQHHSTG